MKKIFVFLFILMFFSQVSLVLAESSASVEINNKINTSNTSNNTAESHTDIKVETNGEVTQYSSDEPDQNIEVKSTDGESSIKVDGKEIDSEVTKSSSKTPTPTPLIEISLTPTPKSKIENFIKEKFSFIEKLFSFLGSL